MGVLTRRELATDEIATRVCGLLEDEDPRLRQEVLRRVGLLMKESRCADVGTRARVDVRRCACVLFLLFTPTA